MSMDQGSAGPGVRPDSPAEAQPPAPIDMRQLIEKVYQLLREDLRLTQARSEQGRRERGLP